MLDSEEYLHLAIEATNRKDHHSALELLHKAIELEPSNAKAKFLLAAQHAELGLTERALSELEECLDLDGSLEMASVQAALLYIAGGKNVDALRHLDKLEKSSRDEIFITFAAALKSLVADDVSSALSLLNQTMDLGIENHPLQEIVKKIHTQLNSTAAASATVDIEKKSTSSPSNIVELNAGVLRAYEKPSFEDDDE